MHAAGGGVAQRVGDAGAVADDEEAGAGGLQVLVDLHFHVVELDLHAVEQRVVVGGARGDLVEGVDHLDDAVEDALGDHQTQIAGRGGEGGRDKALGDAGLRCKSLDLQPFESYLLG